MTTSTLMATLTSSSATGRKLTCPVLSSPRCSKLIPQLDFIQFSQWNGLRRIGISISRPRVKLEKKRECRNRGVYASLFGVGAPEALVIGVVALLVFGPKGLAEVARNLGKTLRAFQPTIRELQEVSREFKSTLEREIGLDDIPNSVQSTPGSTKTETTSFPSSNANSDDSNMDVDPNGSSATARAYSSEEYLKITEDQLKASVAQQQNEGATLSESQSENETVSSDTHQEAASVMPSPIKPESQS